MQRVAVTRSSALPSAAAVLHVGVPGSDTESRTAQGVLAVKGIERKFVFQVCRADSE
jgi:hypothetical protein